MKASKLWLLAGIPLALAACGENDTEAEEDSAAATGTDTMAVVTAPATPAAPMDTGAAAMTGSGITLNPVGGSGVTGQATVTDQAGQTHVAIQLNGLQPNSRHAGHIHQGTCDAPGAPVAPLPEITADANGAGSANGTASVATATAMNGQHIVAYHQGGADNAGPPIVCGAIPGHSM